MLPQVSIVMVNGSYREKFHTLDAFSEQTLAKKEFEVTWVEHYSTRNEKLLQKIAGQPNFRIISLERQGVYHSSFCFNQGIRASAGEILVLCDADIVVEPDFIERVRAEHLRNENLVMYCYRYEESEPDHRENWDLEHLKKTCKLYVPFNYGACLTVRKKWLAQINGYEQHPIFATAVHSNGRDLYTRFKNFGLDIKWDPALRLYHPWHPRRKASNFPYEIQNVMTNYRARKLLTQAYDGLDPALNSPVPRELVEELDRNERKLRWSRYGFAGKMLYFGWRAKNKIMSQPLQ